MSKPGTREGVKTVNGRSHQVGTAKLNERQRRGHRDAIKVSLLLNTLHKNAMGTLKRPLGKKDGSTAKGDPYELSPSQVKSIDILLSKALPSLTAQDITVRSETPTMTPQELQHELGKLLRALPEAEIDRLRSGEPALQVIEGEIVK